jgi:multisubunit Na+/H+ antiporter MnhE subunit
LTFGLIWWAALVALWLLLVESLATAELVAGAVAAALAASVAEAVRERGYMRFAPDPVWLVRVPRVAWQILEDCWILARALARQLLGRGRARGLLIRVPVRYGDDSSRAAARRALLNFGVSITPNSYVVDLDEETTTVLVHQLVPGGLDPLLQETEPTADDPNRGTASR